MRKSSSPSASSSSRLAVRPVTSRNIASASASSVARRRRARMRTTAHSTSGRRMSTSRTSSNSTAMRCTVVSARALAERTPPSNIDISPNSAPGPSTVSTDSRSSDALATMAIAAGEHDVEVRRGLVLLEDRVAAPVARESRAPSQLLEQLGRQCAEEVGLVEHGRACRHVSASCPRGRLSEPARGRPVCVLTVTFTSAQFRPRPERFRRPRPVKTAAGGADETGMFVEGVRLFVVVLGTAAGFWAARTFGTEAQGLGGMLGCLLGYVSGGILGRVLDKAARRGRDAGSTAAPRPGSWPARSARSPAPRSRSCSCCRSRCSSRSRSRSRWSASRRGSSATSATGSSPARAKRCSSCSVSRPDRSCARRPSTRATACSSTRRS